MRKAPTRRRCWDFGERSRGRDLAERWRGAFKSEAQTHPDGPNEEEQEQRPGGSRHHLRPSWAHDLWGLKGNRSAWIARGEGLSLGETVIKSNCKGRNKELRPGPFLWAEEGSRQVKHPAHHGTCIPNAPTGRSAFLSIHLLCSEATAIYVTSKCLTSD